MRKKLNIYLILLGTLLLLKCSAISKLSQQQAIKGPEFSPYDGLKTSVAVLDFENYTDQGGEKFGSAVSDMIVSLLIRSGRFNVIERQRIQQVFEEQALGQTGAVTEETAPRVGQLLGVQSLIIGNIAEASQKTGSQEFTNDDDDKKDFWAFALKATVGHVKFHYRVVNTTTGEIVLADDVSATEIRPGFGIKTKDFDFEDMFELDQTILGIATRKAVNKIAKTIVKNSNKIEWQGKIVRVKEDSLVYFTPGKRSGVKIGNMFKVFGKSSDFSEEDTELMELVEKGIVKVIDFVGGNAAIAITVEGGSFETGDRLKLYKIELQ